jgi:hypothetical protein
MRIYGEFLAADIDIQEREGAYIIEMSLGYRGSFCHPERIMIPTTHTGFDIQMFRECLTRIQNMSETRRFLTRVVEDMRREEQPRYVGPNVILGNQPNYFEWLRNGR